ncbi:MAG: hypothetical protein WD066_18975 [Planctomycetaceae bacterium]
MTDLAQRVAARIAPPRPSFDHVAEIVRDWYHAIDGELHIGGVPVGKIAEEFGTPAYIYSEDVLDRKWAAFQSALPAEFEVHYSIKANPHQAFLRYFLERGCGLEIASGGELFQALAAGSPGERIIFAGPAKTDDDLAAALDAGVGEIHVESLRELARLNALAANRQGEHSVRRVAVALRINADSEAEGGAMRMGGRATPFGIDESLLPEAVGLLRDLPHLVLHGVHLFTGTQILDATVFERQYRTALRIARKVADLAGEPLRTIDFGGGLGVPYFPHEQPLDLRRFGEVLAGIADEARRDPRLSEARLVLEPGRFLVAEAGIYLARVLDVKRSRETTFAILDGGMHHHLAASGNLGQSVKRNYPIALAGRLGESPHGPVELAGPLCAPLDVLGRGVHLPAVAAGDLVAVFQSGAYGRSASPLGFLSHPVPPEDWVANGACRLIRRRGEHGDLLAGTMNAGNVPVSDVESGTPGE